MDGDEDWRKVDMTFGILIEPTEDDYSVLLRAFYRRAAAVSPVLVLFLEAVFLPPLDCILEMFDVFDAPDSDGETLQRIDNVAHEYRLVLTPLRRRELQGLAIASTRGVTDRFTLALMAEALVLDSPPWHSPVDVFVSFESYALRAHFNGDQGAYNAAASGALQAFMGPETVFRRRAPTSSPRLRGAVMVATSPMPSVVFPRAITEHLIAAALLVREPTLALWVGDATADPKGRLASIPCHHPGIMRQLDACVRDHAESVVPSLRAVLTTKQKSARWALAATLLVRHNPAALSGMCLKDIDLSGANLSGALLHDMNLAKTNLSGACLSRVDVVNTVMDETVMTNTFLGEEIIHFDAELLRFSAHGERLIAIACEGRSFYVMDATTYQEYPTLSTRVRDPVGLEISPDGMWFAALTSRRVMVFNTTEMKLQRMYDTKGHTAMCFGPNNCFAMVGSEREVQFFADIATDVPQLFRLVRKGVDGCFRSLTFSPDGTRLAGTFVEEEGPFSRTRLVFYETVTFTPVCHLVTNEQTEIHPARFLKLEPVPVLFSSDTVHYAYAASTAVCLRALETHTVVAVLRLHTDTVTCLAFSSDNKILLSGGEDHLVVVWCLLTMAPAHRYHGHVGPITQLSVSTDNVRVASAAAGACKVWEIPTHDLSARKLTPDLIGGTTPGIPIKSSPDGRFLACPSLRKGRTLVIDVVDTVTQRNVFHSDALEPPADGPNSDKYCGFSPNNRFLAVITRDSYFMVCDIVSGFMIHTVFTPFRVLFVTFSPDSSVLCYSMDTLTTLFFVSATEQFSLPAQQFPVAHKSGLLSAHYSHDGTRIVSLDLGFVACVWDVTLATCIATVHDVDRIAWSPGPELKFIATSSNWLSGTKFLVWDNGTESLFKSRFPITRPSPQVCLQWVRQGIMLGNNVFPFPFSLADAEPAMYDTGIHDILSLSKDGIALCQTKLGCVQLWDMTVPRSRPLEGRASKASDQPAMCLARSATHIATGHGSLVKLWHDSSLEECAWTLKGHKGVVYSLEFSRDGARLVSASYDRTVRVWRVADATPITVLKGHTSTVYVALLSPHDDTIVVSFSEDNTLRVWDAVRGGAAVGCMDGFPSRVVCAAFAPKSPGQVVAGLWDHSIVTIDINTRSATASYPHAHTGRLTCVAFSPDGHRLWSGDDTGEVVVWAVEGLRLVHLRTLRGHVEAIVSVVCGRDRVLTTDAVGSRVTWQSGTLCSIRNGCVTASGCVVAGDDLGVRYVALENDNTQIAEIITSQSTMAWATSGRNPKTFFVGEKVSRVKMVDEPWFLKPNPRRPPCPH